MPLVANDEFSCGLGENTIGKFKFLELFFMMLVLQKSRKIWFNITVLVRTFSRINISEIQVFVYVI